MLSIIAIVLCIFLFRKVHNLEEKIKLLTKGEVSKVEINTVQAKPIVITEVSPVVPPIITSKVSPVVETKAEKASDDKTEFMVGSKVLTGVGVLALILGVSFFLRYAFDNNLISESMRVFIGFAFGIGTVVGGILLRKKYAQYGNTLAGGGLGILYLTAYASHAFYGLIDIIPAFIILLLITGAGVTMALSFNSKPLVSYAFLGAFVIPFILDVAQSVHVLFGYLIILNIGVLLVARFKMWPEFTVATLGATSLIYIQWVYTNYNPSLMVQTSTYLTIIFIIYFTTSLLNFVFRDRDYKGIDGVLMYITPIAYFLLSLTIIHGKLDIALLSFAIGLFYIVLSLAIRAGFGEVGELKKFSNALLCVALPFIALSTALYFEGRTVTIAWMAEAVIMVLVGKILSTKANRIAGLILSVLVGVRVLFIDIGVDVTIPIFNERSVIFLFLALGYFVIWKLYNSEAMGSTDETKAGRLFPAMALYATVFGWVTLEIMDFVDRFYYYLPVAWMILVLAMVSMGIIFREKVFRNISYVLLFITIVYAAIAMVDLPSDAQVIFNIRIGTTLLLVAVCTCIGWLLNSQNQEFSKEEKNLSKTLVLLTNCFVVWAISFEILDFVKVENTKRVSLSAFWLAYALIGLGVGIIKRSVQIRYASIILFAVSVFKIFLYDTSNLSDVYRFVSFITLGIILLIAGFAYYRFKHRIMEFVSGEVKTDTVA